MTTFLQNRWLNCNEYLYSIDASSQIENYFSTAAQKPNLNKVDVNLANIPENGNLVISNESLISIWPDDDIYANGPKVRGLQLENKRKIAINSIEDLTDQVLITVREPYSWIRSFYAHYVRTGGTVSIDKFIIEYEDIIRGNLDLTVILKTLKKKNFNVLVMPCELFKSDEVGFWEKYERVLGVPKPSELIATDMQDNVTPYESISLHLALNQILEILTNDAKKSNCEAEIVSQANFTRKWLGRRALLSDSFDEAKLKSYFSDLAVIPPVKPLLTESLRESIKSNYVEQLILFDPNEPLFENYIDQ